MTEPKTRTVVCRIEGIRRHRPVTDRPTETLDDDLSPFEIMLSIGESAYLQPGAADIAETFESVRRANLYIFLDLESGSVIRSFRIAHSGFVKRVTRGGRGYSVRLHDEPAAHFIPLRPDPTAMLETLLSAQYAHQPVALRPESICEPTIAARAVAATAEMLTAPVRIAPYVDLGSLTAVNYEQALEAPSLRRCFPTFRRGPPGCDARSGCGLPSCSVASGGPSWTMVSIASVSEAAHASAA